MWSPFAESPPRSVAPGLDQVDPPIGEVRRDLDPDVRHQLAGGRDQALHLGQRDLGGPVGRRGLVAERRAVARPPLLRRPVGDLGDLAPVVARMGHEVLQDHLLDVAVLGLGLGEGLERGDPVVRRLADPDQDPARERDPQLAGGPDRLQPTVRVLGRRALMDDEVRVGRLEHQPLRGGHLAQPGEVIAREHAEVGVREHPALERPLAGPDHVGDEIVVAVLGQAARDLRVDLGQLAGEHQQLLGVSPHRLLETVLDLLGRVEVRPMGRERAVLAVAPARARQREGVVAGEGDPAHGSDASATYLLRSRTSASLTACATPRTSDVGGSAPSAYCGPAITKR